MTGELVRREEPTSRTIENRLSESDAASWWGWRTALTVAGLILLLYMFLTPRTTLWDRDEPRFARAAVEMIESGNWLVPTFNGELRPDKPVLIYWLMSVPIRLLGPTELACRFWGPVGTAISCLLVYYIGRRLFDATAGLLAMLVYGLCPLTGMLSVAATADAVVIPFNLGVMAMVAHLIRCHASAPLSFAEACGGVGGGHASGKESGSMAPNDGRHATPIPIWYVLPLGLLIGGAMLAKSVFGLLPLVAVAGIVVIHWWQCRRASKTPPLGQSEEERPSLRPLVILCLAAAAIGAAIFLAWFIPADRATGGALWNSHFGRHVFDRAVGPIDAHGGVGWTYLLYLPFYVLVVLVGLFPWTLLLPGAMSAVAGRRAGGATVFLLGWAIPAFVLVTLVATKQPNYVHFVTPAMALAIAAAVRGAEIGTLSERDRKWLKRGAWLFVPLWLGLMGAAVAWLWMSAFQGFATGLVMAVVVVAATGAAALRYHWGGEYRRGVLAMAGGMAALLLVIAVWLAPVAEQYKISGPLAKAITADVGPDVSAATFDYREPSLNFYLARPVMVLKGYEDIVAWARQGQPGVLVMTRASLEKALLATGPLGLREIAAVKGYNHSAGKWQEVVALRRANLP